MLYFILPVGRTGLFSRAHFSALSGAAERIRDAVEACRRGYGTDLAASDLERAAALLGEIDGRGVSEAVVSEIFSRFCVGK